MATRAPPSPLTPLARTALALAAAAALGSVTQAQAQAQVQAQQTPVQAQAQPPAPAAADAATLTDAATGSAPTPPIVLQARELRARPDLDVIAEGDAELSRGNLSIRADRLSYDVAEDLATARGDVRIRQDGARFAGPELQLRLERFEGFFLAPVFHFDTLGTSGSAERVDFLGGRRLAATRADYTSCPREDPDGPDWVLEADRVTLDLDRNEGHAEGARLRFLGVPILALPGMSFPLSDDRKSGWLPPSVDISNRSGVELAVPYYWNIAPQRDATITPRVMTRRGFGVEGEFRWLEPRHQGLVAADWIPNDRVTGTSRSALKFDAGAALPQAVRLNAELIRVSDDDWWKDFPRSQQHIVPRLLPAAVQAERDIAFSGAEGLAYARVLQWQVLQDPQALIDEPYARDLQLGVAGFGRAGPGFEYRLETELNQFSRPQATASGSPPLGQRLHAVGSLARPWRDAGWWLVPRLSFNAAGYHTDQPMNDGQRSASRLIPTFSVDSGLEFERPTEAFGRTLRQTLEPRVMYVNTPYREQGALPNFDAAGKDFNFDSIFSDNDFSGVDRVSDAHRITAGLTSRLVDDRSGVELLRVGVVQRYQLRDQLVTPDGVPITQPWSDLLLLGSTNLLPQWVLDASVQYNADIARPVRAVLGARWSPGPFRTVAASYRLVRGSSEQAAVGWQWPLTRSRAVGGERCSRNWYSVGRINYSLKDSRITDSIVGFEVDAGCWVGRIVAERQSTGFSEATTRLLLQLELVGLSRIGSNPLRVLKDNIPGYRLLREERGTLPATDAP